MRFLAAMSVVAAAVAVVAPAVASAKPSTSARRCRPGKHVLAHDKGVVIWSAGRHGHVSVYLCAPSKFGRHVLGAGGKQLKPSVSSLEVEGHFAAFFLTTGPARNEHLVVFNTSTERRELSEFITCAGTRACALATAATGPPRYVLAKDGWVAEVWTISGYQLPDFSTNALTMVATNDGHHYYSVDFGSRLSSLSVTGNNLSWTNDLGGASSVELGAELIPGTPQPLTACQLLETDDVTVVLGAGASSSGSASQCTYTSESNSAMKLTVSLQTGISPSQQTSDENTLQDDGWQSLNFGFGGFDEFLNSVTTGGGTHEQLDAFQNGDEWSFDLSDPGTHADEQLWWLSYVAYDRLFGIGANRAQ